MELASFNPLHVGAPTGTDVDQGVAEMQQCFNPLHVGAPTDITRKKAEKASFVVSIPSMSGHLLT